MNTIATKKTAQTFCENWKGRGYEKGDAQVFWTELLQQVVGMKNISQNVRFELRTPTGGFIDAIIPDAGVIVEQKGLGVDLDKPEERQGRLVTPFEQALAYAESFPRNRQPRFIVVCNFGEFRIHDRDACARNELAENFVSFTLEELGESPHLLGFITDPANSRAEKEKRVSMEAGRLIGELHTMLSKQYIDPDSEESQHALNVLCVRLVFCLFCEDAELFPKDAFLNYLRKVEPENMRIALKRLFRALNTPIAERDPYDESVKPFPYVNGGLFADEEEIPNFTLDIKHKLLFDVSQQTDWSSISPTIFGGIFESTLNPVTRRSGGMHYTSPENIHKVINPLFLDDLREELDSIRSEEGATPRKKKNALRKFRKKLASLKFLDPACGSGNFLTETYLSLRKLEDDVLAELNDGQVELALGDESDADEERVSLSQFYGIEINDFAVRVARTALWIAQLQANAETDMLLDATAEDFPLRDSANIVEANALRIDWNDVLPASECSYVMGNPPFLGASYCDSEQKQDVVNLFGKIKLSNSLDYVSGWYYKACEMMSTNPSIRTALVSTNSICQGEQVAPLWATLHNRFGVHIDFAWTTFVWNNEAANQAHVHCVIVGFSLAKTHARTIFSEKGAFQCKSISPYLVDAPFAVVGSKSKPICPVPRLTKGSQASDGGNLILTNEEKDLLIRTNPSAAKWLRPFVGAYEFLRNTCRWCLWIKDVKPSDLLTCPQVLDRVRKVSEFRSKSSAAPTRKMAEQPQRFFSDVQPSTYYIAIPRTSSQRRKYLPVGFMSPLIIASDNLSIVHGASLYMFGVLQSQIHNAWMKIVCGRLKSDYRYSGGIVYNNFPWPGIVQGKTQQPSVDSAIRNKEKDRVELSARAVLDARALYSESTLADMYDPNNEWMFPELFKAHRELDAAVEAAYGVDFQGDEEKIVAHLFKLYAELTEGE